jgi:hypothetical protein
MLWHKAGLALIKLSNAKHRGPFYYINRNKRLGRRPKMMSAKDYAKFKVTLRIARQRAKTRSRGRRQMR